MLRCHTFTRGQTMGYFCHNRTEVILLLFITGGPFGLSKDENNHSVQNLMECHISTNHGLTHVYKIN